MCDQHEFYFEFDKAYNHKLIDKFEASPEHPLTEDVAPVEKGVYALYYRDELVYAGKALNTRLNRRLAEHFRKIISRKNIEVSDVTCRFLVIRGDWFVRAAEDALIQNYMPAWQASGFGSHVPGVGRPGIRVSRWDQDYPPKDDTSA
ncbi:MAG: Eco29kI family restriction endonuclease [Chloroflexi bacterium]|nr:MAG: Eco29kI family restriction endonuclease [Chloroflexota bacterium]